METIPRWKSRFTLFRKIEYLLNIKACKGVNIKTKFDTPF